MNQVIATLRRTALTILADVLEAVERATGAPPKAEKDEPTARTDENGTGPYCTVQDLSPFGIRIESRHSTMMGAQTKANRSPYLLAMTVEKAERIDQQLIENAVKLYGESARP